MIRPLQLASLGFFVSLGLAVPACTNRPVVPIEPGASRVGLQRVHAPPSKIDLLFVVDNSSSMADKQTELAERIPALVAALTAPHTSEDGRTRQVKDIHVGVITSSLGSHGTASCPSTSKHRNDGARLLPRPEDPTPASGWTIAAGATDPTPTSCPAIAAASTLRWTYAAEGASGGLIGPSGASTLETAASCVVASAQDDGCGYEETLEAMYHFLIDPAPYASAEAPCTLLDGSHERCDGDIALTMGNQTLLDQRHAFLRADSLVAVVILSDENDASLMPQGDNWKPWAMSWRMNRGWSGCANVPDSFQPTTPEDFAKLANDYHCQPCADPASDPACAAGFYQGSTPIDQDIDAINLRAFDQLQRFGKSFLWPTNRYVLGLTQSKVVGSDGQLGTNPLFAGNGRDPSTVLVAGIVGVPKTLVTNADGTPKNLTDSDWEKLISDDRGKRDPHMIESIAPRLGIPKFTGDWKIDPMNGGDRDVFDGTDLQYACIADRAVVTPVPDECDRPDSATTDPICGADHTVPRFKAYPGLRHLRVLHDLGPSGLVASICDTSYAGAIQGVIDRIDSALDHECSKTIMDVDAKGNVDCLLFESFEGASVDGKTRCEDLGKGYCTPGQTPCRQEGTPYPPLTPEEAAAQLELPVMSIDAQGVATDAQHAAYVSNGNVYVDGADGKTHLVCELMQLAGGRVDDAQTQSCEHDPAFSIAAGAGGGFCYSSDPAVVGAACAKQGATGTIRFVGDVEPAPGAELYTYCVK